VDLSGYFLLPGLTNAHDHLEFALFPRLGRGGYRNSRQWAEEIYHPDQSPIREHLRVPKWVRLWWGGIRNLLSGVTTVCHHNPYDENVFGGEFPVRVLREFGWAHSLGYESDLSAKQRDINQGIPFVIHAAEGIDQTSAEEIYALARQGCLDERTVIVHGNGLNDKGLRFLEEHGASLVWCPSSNHFLFGQTLSTRQIAVLSRKALGSDSPLTSCGDLLDELRFARNLGASATTLYELVTTQASHVLKLKQGEGHIDAGAVADLIAVREGGITPAEALASASYRDVEMVIVAGKVRLLSEELKSRFPADLTKGLELLHIDDVARWVSAPVSELLRFAREALGPQITMCGRRLTQ
jgi:cytosine/adenosine deaminase-related metal-dependent hydrolase